MADDSMKWEFEARAVLAQGERIISTLKERLGEDDPATPILDSWLKDYRALTDPDETFRDVLGEIL